MSFADYDLEAQKSVPAAKKDQPSSELDGIVQNTSAQLQQFGLLINQFNNQKKLVGSKRDSLESRTQTDALSGRISDLDTAIHSLIMNINKVMSSGSKLEVSQRQVLAKDRLSSEYHELHLTFLSSRQAYKERKASVPIKTKQPADERTPLIEDAGQNKQTQQQQQVSLDQIEQTDLQYHLLLTEERNREINRVSEGIQEVNSIFKDLGALVTQQGEQLDTIEENVSQLQGNTKQASRELNKAHDYQKRKSKWSCIFLVALIIVVLVVVLAVVS